MDDTPRFFKLAVALAHLIGELRQKIVELIQSARQIDRQAAQQNEIGARSRKGLRPLDADLTKHLVLHLDEVPRIEEAIGLKPGRANLLRVPVEGSAHLETFDLGIALGQKCGFEGFYNVNRYTPLNDNNQE